MTESRVVAAETNLPKFRKIYRGASWKGPRKPVFFVAQHHSAEMQTFCSCVLIDIDKKHRLGFASIRNGISFYFPLFSERPLGTIILHFTLKALFTCFLWCWAKESSSSCFFPGEGILLQRLLLSSTVRARNNTVADIWMGWASPALLPTSVSSSRAYKTSTVSKHRTCSTSAWSPNLLRAGVSATVSLLGLGYFCFSPSLVISFFTFTSKTISISAHFWLDHLKIFSFHICLGGFHQSQALESSEADKIPIKTPITGMDRCAVMCWNAGNCRNYIAKSLNKLSTIGETADQAWINHSLFSSKNLSRHSVGLKFGHGIQSYHEDCTVFCFSQRI